MKTKLCGMFLVLIVLMIANLQAQNYFSETNTSSSNTDLVYTGTGNVGIGIVSPVIKLQVVRGVDPGFPDTLSFWETYNCPSTPDWEFAISEISFGAISNDTTENSIGIAGIGFNATKLNFGVAGATEGPDAEINVGVFGAGAGEDAERNWGIWGDAIADEGFLNVGVVGIINNCGGAGSSSSRINYGIYGSCADDALSPTHTNWAGYFNGSVIATGGYSSISDAQFKENLTLLSGSLEKVNKMKVYSYSYKTETFPQMNFSHGTHMGLIAQDLEKIFPEMVITARHHEERVNGQEYPAFDYKAIAYDELIPVALQAIQEIDKKLELLKTQTNGISNSLPTKATAYLEQNSPNPFNNETNILYYIPEDISNSLLIVISSSGEVVFKQTNLAVGKNSIQLQGGLLPAGTYYYSLFCENECIATKKMILFNE